MKGKGIKMATNKILLGIANDKIEFFQKGERIYLTEHSWNCGWYWGMGYIGNKDCHTHFNSVFLDNKNIWNSLENFFSATFLTENQLWILKDLFKQAYTLKECAEVYRHGGHCTIQKGTTDIIINKELEERINKDLEIILNKIWGLLIEWENNQEMKEV